MADHTYLDFELTIERFGADYRVRVSSSPTDESAVSELKLPFVNSTESQVSGRGAETYRHVADAVLLMTRTPREFGQWLFESVFRDEVLVNLRSSLTIAQATHHSRLRIRLNLSDAGELVALPWEYLFDPKTNRFFCLSVDTPLVRSLNVPSRIAPLAVKRPLRVLVMIAGPIDLPKLDVEQEWRQMEDALADLRKTRQVIVERVNTPTLAALQDALRLQDYHIFHFIGHSSVDEQTQLGTLMFEDSDRYSVSINGERLATILHDARSLRLAVLNSCSSARVDTVDPFTGVGQMLLQQGIPAVIAMQYDITDQASLTLSHTFYKALASGYPVDAALAEARKAIVAHSDNVEWGTPVLYMHASDGQIFAVGQSVISNRLWVLLATAGIGSLILLSFLLSLSPPICRDQLLELVGSPRPDDVYSYISRYVQYREAYKYACARRDLGSALGLNGITNDDKAKIHYGYAVLELVDGGWEEAHKRALRGLQYNPVSDGITALLNLADGLALCRLDQPMEAHKRIEIFLKLANTQPEAAPYRLDAMPLRGIRAILDDLSIGQIPTSDCHESSRDLP